MFVVTVHKKFSPAKSISKADADKDGFAWISFTFLYLEPIDQEMEQQLVKSIKFWYYTIDSQQEASSETQRDEEWFKRF